MDALAKLRVVLVHDWLTGMRGGEKCLETFGHLWPDAPLYTLLHKKGSVSETIHERPINTSFFQWFPGVSKYYRYLLPFMPMAARWSLPDCDVVLSSSHCVAKAARPPEGTPHVCYCFTPMRYAWHMRESYFGAEQRSLKSRVIHSILTRLRRWDASTANRVTHFVAISQTVQSRIRQCYGRTSDVIYPPVDTDFYRPQTIRREDYYLVISAFAPYKRLDLAIAACNRLGRRLVVIGTGQAAAQLRGLGGDGISFLGWQPDEVIRDHMCRCRALLFPGEEDFGIVPVEAQACGTPVIAFGKGGATETVIPPHRSQDPTGLWFDEQTEEALVEAITEFESVESDFAPARLRRHAEWFHKDRFREEIRRYVEGVAHGSPAVSDRRAA
ncbi:MAG: glycosyltransferase [Gemmataceae bacterium]